MTKPLDELYFTWLYSQVAFVKPRRPSRSYWKLTRHLYTREFLYHVDYDGNRAHDGIDLRYEFLEQEGLDEDVEWLSLPCSVFEMMIGIARRLFTIVEKEPAAWFWELIDNLNLTRYDDRHYRQDSVDRIITILLYRLYTPAGVGGMFPLRKPASDQRTVELWYQMNAYLIEMG
jgi:hypothetical protein